MNFDGGGKRMVGKNPWPPDRTGTNRPYITVFKYPRQGGYDNVHIHPEMVHPGNGGHGAHHPPIVAAPFCADMCLHLHWRWGTVSLNDISNRGDLANFLGWGDGRRDQGAHTARGAPLVPPNQRIDLEVHRQTLDATRLRYIVSASNPGVDEWQVFLEQRLAFAYEYVLPSNQLALLAVGTLAVSPFDGDNLREELQSLRLNDSLRYELKVRSLFHQIYQRIRFYDKSLDATNDAYQQVPEATASGATDLENA